MEQQFGAVGAAILGVSPDTLESHEQFKAKNTLGFPLLADPERALCQRYGVWRLRERDGRQFMGVVRTTFLIDKDGVIRKIYPVVEIDSHAAEVLQDAGALA